MCVSDFFDDRKNLLTHFLSTLFFMTTFFLTHICHLSFDLGKPSRSSRVIRMTDVVVDDMTVSRIATCHVCMVASSMLT